MGREVRRVPANWEHPKRENGRYIPLHGGSVSQRQAEWDEEFAQWQRGFRRDYANDGWKPREDDDDDFEGWYGKRPVPEEYMPDWPESERTHYQMYEDTSEGTPISPVMATPEELARWLADNGASAFAGQTASYESWLRVCNGGYAPSALVVPGTGMVNGVDAMANLPDR